MEKNSLPFLIVFTIFFSSIFMLQLILKCYAWDDEFTRPPAGNVIVTPTHRSDSEPQQVHISLAGKDHMRVTWITNDEHARSIVEYGTESGRYESEKVGKHTYYDYFNYSSGKIHHVNIGPLKPSTSYFYRCGGHGPEFSFRTPPPDLPLEFVVVGDLGQTEWTRSTLEHVNGKDYDVFLLPGDLSYANGKQPLWDSFGRLVEPYATRRPWMVTEGNHDVEMSPATNPTAFKAYNARWLMPYEESSSTSNLYYSFEVAGVHVIMLGSYVDFDIGSSQYKWLESDLASIDRVKTPWVVVVMHAPWYNTNTAHDGEGEGMRQAMEELLYKARVDLVFAGHVHAYERFSRIYDNKHEPCGPVYITIGDGGNREGLAMTFKEAHLLSVYREASFGHGRLKIIDREKAHWSWHRNNDSESFLADKVWLHSLSSIKQCSSTPPSSTDEDNYVNQQLSFDHDEL